MPKARKRKTPITRVETASSFSSTPRSSRAIIRQFHVLLRQQAKLQNSTTQDAIGKTTALADVEHQIAELGGLRCYQRMSAIGQSNDRGGGSEKVLIEWLKEMELNRQAGSKLQLLEVGALKPDNYSSCSSWINCTSMDLRSRHPLILEQDFLLLDETKHKEQWSIISLSLVLNFVPKPIDRGRMLQLAHRMLAPGGHLFLTLPLPCVANSRYLDFAHLKTLMETIGFLEIRGKWKNGGKMAYWLFQKHASPQISIEGFQKKATLRPGNRNNFCILLQ